MGSSSDAGARTSGSLEAGNSDSTIEIKIETLHSRTYTLRVDKHITVLALKEQIATVSGVPSQVVQLLYRRSGLQNDQCLSAYGSGSRGLSLQGSDVAPGAASRQREPLLQPLTRQLENQANMTNSSGQMGSQMNPIIPARASGHISASGSTPNQIMNQGSGSEAGSSIIEDDPDRPSLPSP